MSTEYNATPTIPPAPAAPSRTRRFLKKAWPLALAGVVGLTIGGASMSAGYTTDGEAGKGKPVTKVVTETVTPEPEVVTEEVTVEVVDPACRAAAEELFSIIQTTNEKVSIPYSDIVITLIDQLQYGMDPATLDGVTATLQNVNQEVQDITTRIENVSPDYVACTGG